MKLRKNCTLAVDIIVYTRTCNVVMIKRKNKPYGYALPGGFVEENETCKAAAIRELYEELGIATHERYLKLVGVVSKPQRDPRGRVVSVVYALELDNVESELRAGDDAKSFIVQWINVLLGKRNIVFDHKEILWSWKRGECL